MFEAGSSAIFPTLASNSWLRPSRPVLSFLQIDRYADRRLHVTVRFSSMFSSAFSSSSSQSELRFVEGSSVVCKLMFAPLLQLLPFSPSFLK